MSTSYRFIAENLFSCLLCSILQDIAGLSKITAGGSYLFERKFTHFVSENFCFDLWAKAFVSY